MLPSYVPWCSLEAYRREVTVTNYFWWKWEKLRNYLGHRRSRPYIYLSSHFFWVKCAKQVVLHSVISIFCIYCSLKIILYKYKLGCLTEEYYKVVYFNNHLTYYKIYKQWIYIFIWNTIYACISYSPPSPPSILQFKYSTVYIFSKQLLIHTNISPPNKNDRWHSQKFWIFLNCQCATWQKCMSGSACYMPVM